MQLRLAWYFGTSAQYWLYMQNRFDLESVDKFKTERDVLPTEAA
jgi:plasmid maintenance system antidote protein VapI